MGWRIYGSCISIAVGLAGGWCAWPLLAAAESTDESVRGKGAATAKTPAGEHQTARFKKEIEPLLSTYCYDCHGDGSKKGELAIDAFPDVASMQKNRDVWLRIRDHLNLKLMPPPDKDQPEDQERKTIVSWIDEAVFPVDPANPDPGRILLRRLNREEYRNTIRDLLEVDVAVENVLPPDDAGYGFDNIGDVLTLSPVHIERYLKAARLALDEAVHVGPMPMPVKTVPGGRMDGPGIRSGEGHYLWKAGEATTQGEFPRPGRYKIHLRASGTPGDKIPPKMDLLMDGNLLESWDVPNRMESPGKFTREIRVESTGRKTLTVSFQNDFWNEALEPSQRDRNLMVNSLAIEGPLDGPPPPKPASHRRIFGEKRDTPDDRAYALGVLTRFAAKAFRRPIVPGEIDRYLRFLDVAKSQGQDAEQGIRLALEAMLVSPSFLFRQENVLPAEKAGGIVKIDEFALASRLSYFLWSSMPDERLMQLAAEGKLRANLGGEITRMLGSPRAKRFVSNFGGQWLQLRNLVSATPDEKRFPGFKRGLTADMRRETEMLLEDILRQNLPVTTLLTADYSFINEPLAAHYGIQGVSGREFRKVSLAGTPRRGILGQGAVLVVTSYPTRTSPVLRGKYVLENLLDTAPPPPPPNVPQLGRGHGRNTSLREQLEEHRKDPSCSTCHALMDPIGFGLEAFDGVGAFRDSDNGKPLDTSGTLADGGSFANADELRNLLVSRHSADFRRAVASKLLTYALGRGLEWYDRPAVDAIIGKAATDGDRLQTFVRAVVDSVPFQYRRPTPKR